MADDNKYTDPELRRQLKEEIQQSDKGGRPGQWSARKSQLLVREYEKRGGGYRGEKDEAAKSLEHWTAEQWQTREGDADARNEDGSMKRYLPKQAWELLSEAEKEETERKKRAGAEAGQQFVENTRAAHEARRAASVAQTLSKQELYKKAQALGIRGRSKLSKAALARAVNQAQGGS